MVKEIRTFKLRQHIVINYAKRLHKKYSLSLPVDLEKIAKKYAQLRYTDIPFEIDGISANLKKICMKKKQKLDYPECLPGTHGHG